jgi:hypothetical protein
MKLLHIKARTAEDAFLQLVNIFQPADVEKAVELLIQRLDDADDHEDVPDFTSVGDGLPGDPNDAEDAGDGQGDTSWTEWHTRGRHKLDSRGSESRSPLPGTSPFSQVGEDEEDDDAAEADGDEEDGNVAEDEPVAWFGLMDDGQPGCSISDAGEHDDLGGGHCNHFGIDQTIGVGELEAFHDLNGIPLIKVAAPEIDR